MDQNRFSSAPAKNFISPRIFIRVCEMRIDMFRVVCLRNPKHSARIQVGLEQIRQLICDYTLTARRVGSAIDGSLFREVLIALQHATGPQNQNATRQFLIESLCREILALPLTYHDLKICLELLTESNSDF